MRSFFVKETVPYLRTQRSFSQLRFLKIKNFLLSLACAVGVMFCFVVLLVIGFSICSPNFTSQGVGGRVFPLFWCEVTNQHPPTPTLGL